MQEDRAKQTQAQLSSERQAGVSPAAISLPKGGGAIRGVSEKFAANPATGAGSISAPIAVSPGRAGFGPQLSLHQRDPYGGEPGAGRYEHHHN